MGAAIAATVIVAGVTGCSSGATGFPVAAGSLAATSRAALPAPTTVSATSTTTSIPGWLPRTAPDHPSALVAGTLTRMDPCALLSGADIAAVHLDPGDGTVPIGPIPVAPHACTWSADLTMLDALTVVLGTVDSPPYSDAGPVPATSIAGALAYVAPDTVDTAAPPHCSVYLPVSTSWQVRVEAASGVQSHSDVCTQARTAASAVVRALAHSAPAARPHPVAQWSGCVLLAAVLGTTASAFQFSPHFTDQSPLDACDAVPQGAQPDATGFPGEHSLAVSYNSDPTVAAGSNTVVQVGGRPGVVTAIAHACGVEWVYARLPATPYDDGTANRVVVDDTAGSCDQATADALAVQRVLATTTPPASAMTSPLLYPG